MANEPMTNVLIFLGLVSGYERREVSKKLSVEVSSPVQIHDWDHFFTSFISHKWIRQRAKLLKQKFNIKQLLKHPSTRIVLLLLSYAQETILVNTKRISKNFIIKFSIHNLKQQMQLTSTIWKISSPHIVSMNVLKETLFSSDLNEGNSENNVWLTVSGMITLLSNKEQTI